MFQYRLIAHQARMALPQQAIAPLGQNRLRISALVLQIMTQLFQPLIRIAPDALP